jgi:agmatine/peptidylarginine deiminase
VNMANVAFIIAPTDSVWIRDYGPRFDLLDDVRVITDHIYNRPRTYDDGLPIIVANQWHMPCFDLPLYSGGGNFLPAADGSLFMTTLVTDENPGLSAQDIADLMSEYCGVSELVLFPRFPSYIDSTGHIDMWMTLIDEDTCIISDFFSQGPGYPAYDITEQATIDMQNRGYTVYRTPAFSDGTHYTYTNCQIMNNKIFVPQFYGSHAARDAQAIATFQAAAPTKTIVGIDCSSVIYSAGAIHCIVMGVPAYGSSAPAAKVLSANGGEYWAAGSQHDIRWAADDDRGVLGVDLYYSTDGGATFPYVIATGEPHDGVYEDWTVPQTYSTQVRLKAVAHDKASNTGEDVSDEDFAIPYAVTTVYTFADGAGVDKWAYGDYTDAWDEDLQGNRLPLECDTPITSFQSNAYGRIAYSDATGGDTDANRYTNPNPGSLKESTLIAVFTLAENPADVLEIDALWEGYADACQHTEMYVWDYTEGNWGSGAGDYGNNNFMDNCSGNVDRVMRGLITVDDDVSRYVGPGGEFTVLVYDDEDSAATFHDYMEVAVTAGSACPGDLNDDGFRNVSDFTLFAAAYNSQLGDPSYNPLADLNSDGFVNVSDFTAFAGNYGTACP